MARIVWLEKDFSRTESERVRPPNSYQYKVYPIRGALHYHKEDGHDESHTQKSSWKDIPARLKLPNQGQAYFLTRQS